MSKLHKMCESHNPSTLGYVAKSLDADKRMKKGQKQKQCQKCGYWFWKHEF